MSSRRKISITAGIGYIVIMSLMMTVPLATGHDYGDYGMAEILIWARSS